jgi:methanogenic corrinoid protein MtbC1
MTSLLVLDRTKLAVALSELDSISQKLPEGAVVELAQEVVRRVAGRLTPALPTEFLPTPEQIEGLCEALISRNQNDAITLIEASQHAGASYEALCQSYLAVASRRLGEWWDDDRVSFYQVSIGAGRIYAILRILRAQMITPIVDLRRSAAFISVPGEDHTLGITIAADMARNRGWDVELMMGMSHDELVLALEERNPPIIGVAASTARALPALIKLIFALRVTNPSSKILLSGHIAGLGINLDSVVGVDAAIEDFDSALSYMERVVAKNTLRLEL